MRKRARVEVNGKLFLESLGFDSDVWLESISQDPKQVMNNTVTMVLGGPGLPAGCITDNLPPMCTIRWEEDKDAIKARIELG